MSISAIVPVWNGRALLERLLTSLDAQTQPAAEVMVIDNGSTDGAPDAARRRGARVIPMGRNAGFAAAVNRGIHEAKSDWLAILNNDVELAPDYFEKLLQAGAPFATGKILSGTGLPACLLDGTYDLTCRGGTTWRAGHACPDSPGFSLAREIHSPPWTATLIRGEVFEKVGLLEETFGSYLEDVDFGLRCAALGLTGRYVPSALAWHLGSATLGPWHPEIVRLIARNQLLILARHFPARFLLGWLWPILVAQVLWGAVALRRGAGFAWLRGKWQGVRCFSGARRAHPPQGTARASTLLESVLQSDEQMIRELQGATGFDWYWRLYFLLTGGAK